MCTHSRTDSLKVNGTRADDTLRRVEVITGRGRRGLWSDEDKARIVAESLEPGTGSSTCPGKSCQSDCATGHTQLINAMRGHLAEHGVIAPQGVANLKALSDLIEDEATKLDLMVVEMGRLYLEQIEGLSTKIGNLEKALRNEAAHATTTARLLTMPGIGPITAMAIETFAPSMGTFKRGRDFAAWLGLVPVQHSSGGKQVLGRTSKMGQRDIRRLLITGAMTVIRWASRKGVPEGSWLARMLPRKPRMLVAVALANKMTRSAWAMLTKNENYRDPEPLAA